MSTGCRSLPWSFLEISGRKSQVSMVWEGSARLREDNFGSRYASDLCFTPGSLVTGQASSLCSCSEAALVWALLPREPQGTMRGSWTLQENKEKIGSSRKDPVLASIPGAVLVTDGCRQKGTWPCSKAPVATTCAPDSIWST